MRSLKTVFSICAQNFRKWQSDYRVWCIGVLLFVMVAIYTEDLRKITAITGTKMPVWIFPFMYTQFYTKLIYTIPVVLLFCNAPFTDRNQTFVYMRTGRIKWLCGQIVYIIAASAVYYLFLLAASLLLTAVGGDFSLEWGRTLNILATSDMPVETAGFAFSNISYFIITFFKPLQAVTYTFLMSWLGGCFIGLLIFFLNLMSGTKYIGVLVSSVFVLLSGAVANDGWERFMYFSPVSWITLDCIDIGGYTKYPSFYYCVSVVSALIIGLIIGVLIFGRKKGLDIKE